MGTPTAAYARSIASGGQCCNHSVRPTRLCIFKVLADNVQIGNDQSLCCDQNDIRVHQGGILQPRDKGSDLQKPSGIIEGDDDKNTTIGCCIQAS